MKFFGRLHHGVFLYFKSWFNYFKRQSSPPKIDNGLNNYLHNKGFTLKKQLYSCFRINNYSFIIISGFMLF